MNPNHEIFIQQLLQHGDKERAYLAAYPKTRFPQAAALADILYAKTEIQSELNRRTKEIEERQLRRSKGIKLLTVRKKRELLAHMVSGEMQVKRHIRVKDLVMEVYEDVSPLHMLRAVELDSKLAADYWKERQYEEPEEDDYEEETPETPEAKPAQPEAAPAATPPTDHQQHYQPYAEEQTPEQELHRHDDNSLAEHINNKLKGPFIDKATLTTPSPEWVYELKYGHKPIAERPNFETWLWSIWRSGESDEYSSAATCAPLPSLRALDPQSP